MVKILKFLLENQIRPEDQDYQADLDVVNDAHHSPRDSDHKDAH